MSPFVFALHRFTITCIEAPFVEIGGCQSVSVQFTSFKKGIHEHAFVYNPGILHNLKAGHQLHVTRRTSRPIHADALSLVDRGILRPVFCELILRGAFIFHARLFVPAGAN
jgi:hypothetical protein